MNAQEIALITAASVGGGVMNALAGGGTILTYPALLFAGESAITANATSTIALWPGAATSMFGYRHEVRPNAAWLRVLFLPSLLGGAIGAVLLLRTPPKVFEGLAPYLILFATVLFVIQGLVSKHIGADAPTVRKGAFRAGAAWIFQFAIGIYGGYFGAGIGILMLAVLGFMGLSDIHAANGIKNFFGMCINGVAAAYFILQGAVHWPAALCMIAGAMAGGYAGARFARRIGRPRARIAVVVIGIVVTALLLWRQSRG